MMRVLLSLLLVLLSVLSSSSNACTVMQLRVGGQRVVARNHDWITGGGLVMINPRGIEKRALSTINPKRWTSEYGSVSFNQFGREIPFAGMNEAGLTVDLLQLPQARFPEATDPRDSVNVVQWVQYQLDTAATVDQVCASLSEVRPMPFIAVLEKVHYFVTDVSGDSAIIEFTDGKLTVRRNPQDACALANSTWADSARAIKEQRAVTGSEWRLLKAREAVKRSIDLPSNLAAVDFAFEMLESVAQPPRTQWSIVYQPEVRRLTFRTRESPKRRWIDFDDVAFDRGSPVLCVDVNRSHSGNMVNLWQPFTSQANQRIVHEAFDAIAPESFLRTAVKALVIRYGDTLVGHPAETR